MGDSILDIALDLADRGIPVFPCLAGTKAPAIPRDEGRGFLDASIDPVEIRRMFAYPGAALIGVPTGAASGLDVVDLDPRHGSDAWTDVSRLPDTRTHATRSGGRHLLFLATPGLRSSASRIAPGVDVRAEGGYVIYWPAHGCARNDTLPQPMPDWLVQAAQAPTRHTDTGGVQPETAPSTNAVVALLDRLPNPAENGRDVWVSVMLSAAGCAQDSDDPDAIADAVCRWAARWPGSLGYDVERSKYDSDFVHRDKPLAGWRNLRARGMREIVGYAAESAASDFPPLPPLTAADLDLEPATWRDRLQRAKPAKGELVGTPKSNLYNATIALESLVGVLRYDEFRDRVVLAARPPWHAGPFTLQPVGDVDYTHMAIWLQGQGVQVPSILAAEAAFVVASHNPMHPVRDYLAGLRYDGVGRIDRWLIDFLGAEDSALTRAIGAKFLISMVARIMEPGCKVDTFLVLEGPQGLHKSTTLSVLAGGDWFTDHIPEIGSKDALLQLQGKWLIEVAEMHTFRRAEMARAKAFISTATDRFRRPYGRTTEDVPRQSVVCGTLNPTGTGYLGDETGNRRFWPVLCAVGWDEGRQVNITALRAVRDQLFAEAHARYQSGERWWLDTRALEIDQAAATDARFTTDAWGELIAGYLAGKNETGTSEIMKTCLRIPEERWSDHYAQRVGRILAKEGWVRRRVRVGAGRDYRYFRSGEQVVVPITLGLAELAG